MAPQKPWGSQASQRSLAGSWKPAHRAPHTTLPLTQRCPCAPTHGLPLGPRDPPCFLLPLKPSHSLLFQDSDSTSPDWLRTPCHMLPLGPALPLFCLSHSTSSPRVKAPGMDMPFLPTILLQTPTVPSTQQLVQTGAKIPQALMVSCPLVNNSTLDTYPNYGNSFRSKNIPRTLIHTLEILLTI